VVIQSTDRLRREGLAAYLQTLPGFTIAGQVAHVEDACSLCALDQPDILVLDAGPDPGEVVSAGRTIRQRFPSVRIVVVYEHLTAEQVSGCREAGVEALVPYGHGLWGVVRALQRLPRTPPHPAASTNGLSDRQREVLLLMASGHSAIEIGELLHISPGTVENHKRRVYAKLNAESAVQAVARAATLGLIGSTPPTAPAEEPGIGSWLPPDREPDDGLLPMVVAIGDRVEELDRVVRTLITARLPVVHDPGPDANLQVHWQRWHRGPVVRVLVNPGPDHWRVAATLGRAAVVVRSGQPDAEAVAQVLANGGLALVPADHLETRLVPVVTLVAQGYLVLEHSTTRPLLTSPAPIMDRQSAPPNLTAREHDILRSIGRSHTVRQTARSLGIAVKTVENAQGHLFSKLGVHNRAHALAAAYRLGLLQPNRSGT
jgi:DNA-binding NarL/FixJ family response regulator